MRIKKFYLLILCGFLMFGVSCSSSDIKIPPAIEPEKPEDPDKPDPDKVYNDLGFELHQEGEPFNTYRGLVMAGYQGWFCTPEDDCKHGDQWYHYQEGGIFEPGVMRNKIDFWPDVSEYEKTYETNFTLPNGKKAKTYSSYDKSSVMLHFKWMKEYGLDGVFMQRFVGEVIDNWQDGKGHFDTVLESAMEASNIYERAICVMYDLGGYEPARLDKVLNDAQEIMDKYQLKDRTKQKYYLHENGKPLLSLWGVGFNDGRPFDMNDIEVLLAGLREKGFSIMLGVPTHWRERRNDALSDPKLHEIIKSADVIMPWFVGRYGSGNYKDFHSLIEQDVKWGKENEVGYAPLCFPGSSDRNMHPNNGVNHRFGGEFLWKQMYHCIKSGAQMLYIAMFDEIDEGTAIYKCLRQSEVPSNVAEKDYWVLFKNRSYSIKRIEVTTGLGEGDWCRLASDLNITFMGIEDDLQSDHYLWLTNQGKKMLRGETPMSETMPTR